MAEKRRKFDAEFREGAVRIVTETGKPVGQVAKDLGINETTLASWVSRARRVGGAGAGTVSPGDGPAPWRPSGRRSPKRAAPHHQR
ncbi:transposase (plasmid) [Streptomyces sp. NBC_00846]|uniref:transposase n=1 Tax=Streptomyces sp. NBC_00846 TaxID=2975849 RepID=UPI002F919DF8|nr:transposase [Streptomyces sp. NBC_00846]